MRFALSYFYKYREYLVDSGLAYDGLQLPLYKLLGHFLLKILQTLFGTNFQLFLLIPKHKEEILEDIW